MIYTEIKKKVILREIAGETMLIPVEETVGEYNGIFTLSPAGALIFKSIQDGKDEDGIIEAVCDAFEVDRAEAESDTFEFLDALRKFGII